MRLALTVAAAVIAPSVVASVVAAPVHADPDIDFAEKLHAFGIYGARDYNAWLGKITCKRLYRQVDTTAAESVQFIGNNLARSTTQAQAVQFLGAAISTYCPDQVFVLQAAAQ